MSIENWQATRCFCPLPLPSARMEEPMPETAHTFEPPFTDVPGAVAEIRAGRMVVVVDDADRENEGDLTLATGSQTLSVTFAPTNTTDYTIAKTSVHLAVNQAALVLTE